MLIHNADITGSLLVNGTGFNTGSFSGSFTGIVAGTTATASYVEYNSVANKPALVSGSSQITYSGLTGIPSGIVSGSSQVTYSGLTGIPSGIVSGSSQVTYSGLTGVPSGIVSGSAQIASFGIFATTGSNGFNGSQSITGSLTVTGQVVAQTLNVQQVTSSIVYSSGSNIFGNSLGNTQQFTGSVSVTGSLTVAGSSAGTTSIDTIRILNASAGGGNLIIQNTSTTLGKIGVTSEDIGSGTFNDGVFKVQLANDGTLQDTLTITSRGAATFSSSITSNYTYNGGGVGMLHLTSNGTEGGSITFEKTSGTAQKYKIGNSGAAFFIYDETGAKQPFTILNNGNVGIGTATSPVAALNVSNVPTSFFGIIETTGTSAGTVKHFRVHKPGYVEYGIGILDTDAFHISTASTFPTTNGFTISSAGNVGIGNTSPKTFAGTTLGALQVGTSWVGTFAASSTFGTILGNNVYFNTDWKRTLAQPVSFIQFNEDNFYFSNAATGAADSTFSPVLRMTITSNGHVTKPYQPAFRAGRSASYNPGADSNIVFNSVFFNIGSHYNVSNGLFTAPIAGRYYFSASVIWESLSDGQEMDDAFTIRANGSVVAYDFRRAEYVAGTTGNNGYYVTNANILLNLAANDTVSIRNNRSLTVHGNEQFSWFVGYLLG